jgi:pyruvate/2-oxoglutarate/acetoin dehydrogenase E1 component
MPVSSASFARLQAIDYEMGKRPFMVYTQQNSIGTATRADGKSIDLLAEFGLDRALARGGQAIDEDWATNSSIGYSLAVSFTGSGVGRTPWDSTTGGVAITQIVSMAPIYTIEYIEAQMGFLQTQVGGQLNAPVIIMQPGSGRSSVTQHANTSAEAKFANVPGVVTINPNKVYDVKGMMHAMIRYGGPCVYVSYGSEASADVPDEPFVVPLGKGNVTQAGKDLTIVATPPACLVTEAAITALGKAGINAEYWEPRTIHPFDDAGIIASVKKTGRLFLVSHGYWTNDFTGHIMAVVAMALPGTKMWRITYPDAGAPCATAMNAWMTPDAAKIQDAVQKFMKM